MKLKDIDTAISDCLGEFYDVLAVTNKVALTKRDKTFIRGARKRIAHLQQQLDEIDTTLDLRLRRSMAGGRTNVTVSLDDCPSAGKREPAGD